MANILYFNLTNVKEAGKSGRPQTIMFDGNAVKHNGLIVTLGDTMEKSKGREYNHVHTITEAKNVDSVIGKWVIASPEIVVEQYRMISDKAWQFALEPNETYPAYELQKYDRLEYSEAYFKANSIKDGLVVGDYVKINAQGEFEKVASGSATNAAFRVTDIEDANKPVVLEANKAAQQGVSFIPQLGKMIKLEVVR